MTKRDALTAVLSSEWPSEHSLLRFLTLLRENCGVRTEAAVAKRLSLYPRAFPKGESVERSLDELHPGHRNIRTLWNALATQGKIAPDQIASISKLLKRQHYFAFNQRLCADLLVRLVTKRAFPLEQTVVPRLGTFIGNAELLTYILTLAVCAPRLLSYDRLRRLVRFRSRRIKTLIDLIFPRVNSSVTAAARRVQLATALALPSGIQRDLFYDLNWCCRQTGDEVFKELLAMAIEKSNLRNCELLVPLLARNSTTKEIDLLRSLAGSPAEAVRLIAKACLASATDL
jgi:hypothetical protein